MGHPKIASERVTAAVGAVFDADAVVVVVVACNDGSAAAVL